jgi:hypothetical protein
MKSKVIHTYALAWEAITPENTINVTKEKDDAGNTVRFKASTPNVAELEPRYGENRQDAILAMQRVLWKYHATGQNIDAANAEK